MAKKEGALELEGTVVEVLPNAMFASSSPTVTKEVATISGKMRQHYIRILLSDRVVVERLLRSDPRPHRLPAQVTNVLGFTTIRKLLDEGSAERQEDLRQVQGDSPARVV